MSRLLGLCAATILLGNTALAHDKSLSDTSPGIPNDSNITKKLAQALNSVFSITLQNYFIASRWNRPGTANVVELRALTPFEVWGQANLLRLNVPFRTESELGPGLSDVRVFDLLTYKTNSGFWGIGPAFNLGINKGPGIDTLQAGPAAGFVISSVKDLSIGLLNQNFFSGQTGFSTIQPILVYQPGGSWTVGLGELPLVYDWKKSRFAVFSMGLQVAYLFKAAGQPIRFFLNPQFNTKSNTQLYHWTITTGVTLPLRALGSR